MSIDCSVCKEHCCGGSPVLAPILFPDEENKFTEEEKEMLPGEKVWRIKRNKEGLCIFLNENKRCTIYDRRPEECRAYPWLYKFHSDGTVSLLLSKMCPQRDKVFPRVTEEYKENFEKSAVYFNNEDN